MGRELRNGRVGNRTYEAAFVVPGFVLPALSQESRVKHETSLGSTICQQTAQSNGGDSRLLDSSSH